MIKDLSSKEKIDYYFKKQNMYIENSKSYIQIGVGALVLPVLFLKAITGQDHNPAQINWLIETSWLCFLISIGAGLLYQYLSVKHIAYLSGEKEWYWIPHWTVQRPGIVYGLMVISFYIGAIIFVAYAGMMMGNISDFTEA